MPLDGSKPVLILPVDGRVRPPFDIEAIKKIVGAAKKMDALAALNETYVSTFPNWRILRPQREIDHVPFLSPHGALDFYLGTNVSRSCSCTFRGTGTEQYLEDLELTHRDVLIAHAELLKYRDKFIQQTYALDMLLAG